MQNIYVVSKNRIQAKKENKKRHNNIGTCVEIQDLNMLKTDMNMNLINCQKAVVGL